MSSFAFEVIKSHIPERFVSLISNIELAPLKNKFSDSNWKNADCSNLVISIFKSVYHLDAPKSTLCKVVNGKIYFPDMGNRGIFDPENLPSDFSQIVLVHLEALFPNAPFGCCHLYLECSDQKECVHPNPFHAYSCMYKKNLENGKVFYGKNRNV